MVSEYHLPDSQLAPKHQSHTGVHADQQKIGNFQEILKISNIKHVWGMKASVVHIEIVTMFQLNLVRGRMWRWCKGVASGLSIFYKSTTQNRKYISTEL